MQGNCLKAMAGGAFIGVGGLMGWGIHQAIIERSRIEADNSQEYSIITYATQEAQRIAAGNDAVMSTEESRRLLKDFEINWDLKDGQIIELHPYMRGSSQNRQEGVAHVTLLDVPGIYSGLIIDELRRKDVVGYVASHRMTSK